MTETQTIIGQARARHRRQPGYRRGDGGNTGRAGAHVILVARTRGRARGSRRRIHAAGGTRTIAPLDLTEGESIGKLAGAIAERWEKLDVLVLNAAMLGSLTSGAGHRSKRIFPTAQPQPACQPGADRRVRSAPSARRARRRRRPYLIGGQRSPAPSGAHTARRRRRWRHCLEAMPTRPRTPAA